MNPRDINSGAAYEACVAWLALSARSRPSPAAEPVEGDHELITAFALVQTYMRTRIPRWVTAVE